MSIRNIIEQAKKEKKTEAITFRLTKKNMDFLNILKEITEISRNELMNKIIEEGKAIKRFADSQNTKYAKRLSFETTIQGIDCIAICKPGNSTALAEKFNDYPLGVVFQYKDGVYSYSLYSQNKDIDCSKIAESFGGGGHKGAAGFTSDYIVLGKPKLYNNLRSFIKKLF